MLRKLSALLCAAALAVSMTACTSSNTASSSTDSNDSSQTEGTVVIYSTHPEKLLTEVADDFTAETGIEVQFINLKGELADRVRSEMGNPQADIMYGGDTSVYMQLADEGAFTATDPSWAGDLKSDFKATDGNWYGTIQTPVMMFYNTDLMSAADAPTDWGDLTDSKYQGQIVSRDYLSSSMRSCICNLTYYYEQQGGQDAATTYLQGLNANTKNYYNSGSMMFKAIGNGEASIGIGTLNDIMDNKTTNGMPLQEIDAASGNVVVTDCIAELKDCQHPEAAQKFLEFAGSSAEQAKLANDFNRMPTLDSALSESPSWMQAGFKTLPADWSVIAQNQSAWLDTWQNTIYSDDKTVKSS